MKVVVFLGPTLPVAEARAIIDGIYLPPARQGSVVSALRLHRPDIIALIDGVFLQDLSVWHKEILLALEQGVSVYGASSMGALRAAELGVFGMRGVGYVFERYSRGVLEDDDEVAVAHTWDADGYRKLSEPMVNVRATIESAWHAGAIDEATASVTIEAAKEIYFADRTIDAVIAALTRRHVAPSAVACIRQIFEQRYVDVKRGDAIQLLAAIRDTGATQSVPTFETNRTVYCETLCSRDRLTRHDDVELPASAIARFAALHDADFESLRFQGLNRVLAATFADVIGIKADAAETTREIGWFRASAGLRAEDRLQQWLSDNDVTDAELADLMQQRATCRKLHRWWLAQARRKSAKTRVVMDEYRLSGRYELVAARTADFHRILDDHAATTESPLSVETLLWEHARDTGFCVGSTLAGWADDVGFFSMADIRRELVLAKSWREARALPDAKAVTQ